jgi:gas vesicle protein
MTKFLLGLGTGFGLGLLFAPASGRETRSQIVKNARELARVPRKKMLQVAEISKSKAGELGSAIGRKAAESAVESIETEVLGKHKQA